MRVITQLCCIGLLWHNLLTIWKRRGTAKKIQMVRTEFICSRRGYALSPIVTQFPVNRNKGTKSDSNLNVNRTE